MKKLKYIVPVLIGVGILALSGLVYIAATRNLSGLESVLLQIISLAIGISVSFFIGRQSAQKLPEKLSSHTPGLRSDVSSLFIGVFSGRQRP